MFFQSLVCIMASDAEDCWRHTVRSTLSEANYEGNKYTLNFQWLTGLQQTKYDLSFAKHRKTVPSRLWQQYLAILEAKYGIAWSNADATSTSPVEKSSEPSAKKYIVVIETSSDEGEANESVSLVQPSGTVSSLPQLEQFTTSCVH